MPDSEAKRKWDKANTVIFSVKFMKKTEQDLIDYLNEGNRSEKIKTALREYMKKESEKGD